MDSRSMRILEYNSIINLLEEQAVTERGKEIAAVLVPVLSILEVEKAMQETTEARNLLRSQNNFSFAGIRNIQTVLHRIEIGGIPDPSELLDVADTLAAGRRLKLAISESEEDVPLIQESVKRIGLFQEIENLIVDSINDLGEIKDSASQELSRIRRQKRNLNEKIREKLDSYIRSSTYQKIIQEPIVTQREGRFVIPIRQESRGQFPGIIHDQSASGATLFIEPMAVVEVNNDLRQLSKKEQQEIEKIIRLISIKIQSRIHHIEESVLVLAHLDFVFAKAKLGQSMDAWPPELMNERSVNLIQARHPLIGADVVPVDISIGNNFDTLVITGPNTGGKTVVLKTLGLLILMAQSGLHIPAKHGSEIGIFKRVLADIGDEQSIEQSLSTFSGHMKNIISMLSRVDDQTLVLLDEIGAGTDPAEGAALAMAILEFLHSHHAKTVATTHYSELKAFAYNEDRVENASVEFNVETLRPTYHLMLGLPGHSNAFAIAGRLGLQDDIISKAKSKISSETMKVDEMIRSVADLKAQVERDRDVITATKREIKKVERDLIDRQSKLKEREKEIIMKAKEEARSLVGRSKAESEDIIRSLRKMQLDHMSGNIEKNLQQAKTRLDAVSDNLNTLSDSEEYQEPLLLKEIEPGMQVVVVKLNQIGEVLQIQEKLNTVEVQIGALKLNVSPDNLRKVKQEDRSEHKKTKKGITKMSGEDASNLSTEIDLRGLTVQEAIEIMDKHMDSAMMSNIPKINIIHGKGTGALRIAVRKHLEQIPGIKSYRAGEAGEGGDGVTVVYLS